MQVSRQLMSGLMAATAVLCVLASASPSQAAVVCTRGKFVTNACVSALEAQIAQANQIVQCLKDMETEYLGVNGAAGAGKDFTAQKKQCLTLISSAKAGAGTLSALDADNPDGGDDANVANAYRAINEWATK
jgi:hypothetical protein